MSLVDASWLPPFAGLTDPAPHARVLSNGRYRVLLTCAGTGESSWGDVQLTAWDDDRVADRSGWFFYLRDRDTGQTWSVGCQPLGSGSGTYDAWYNPGQVNLVREHDEIVATMRVSVDPDVDAEVRSIHLTNRSGRPRRIEITAYAEVVLNTAAAHAAHPAFSKLFVETAFDHAAGALVARRRPRSSEDPAPCVAAALRGPGALEYDSDRARVLGRNRALDRPRALATTEPLGGTVGSVLDPVLALRRTTTVAPGATVTLHAILAAGDDPAAAGNAVVAAVRGAATVAARAAAREADLGAALGIASATAEAFQELAGAIRYGHPALRADAATLARARGAVADLAALGLGAAPFAVVLAGDAAALMRAGTLVTAQAYWLALGLRVDLVVLCGAGVPAAAMDGLAARRPAGAALAVCRHESLASGMGDLLLAAAAMVCDRDLPRLGAAGAAGDPTGGGAASATPAEDRATVAGGSVRGDGADAAEERARADRLPLRCENGIGGFSSDGSEYVIHVSPERRPPLAWVNVIAHERFGMVTSESGATCTWSRNSRERRLTPWANDPLADPHGEALYVRDDARGVVWSAQPGPAGGAASYEIRHGFGATTWAHVRDGLEHEVVAFVPWNDPVRVLRVRVTNRGAAVRKLSVISYQRLVLGSTPTESGRFVVTEHLTEADMILARSGVGADPELRDGVVFAAAVHRGGTASYTGDRAAFIGRGGSLAAPAALCRSGPLDGRVGAGLDPCIALQVAERLAPGETLECAFLLGEVPDRAAAAAAVERLRAANAIDAALAVARAEWKRLVSAVRIETPEPAIDLMVNGWLLYQVVSCRLWGRTALYQSGGAYGFRDQLQDALALAQVAPALTRAQLLRHAAHQFVEGDVLHWWHPPGDHGIRTRFSDDLLWLPALACDYARITGDWDVFDAAVDFMVAPRLAPGQDEAYLHALAAHAPATLFEHCCRAIDRSLATGAHGLPLMGTGDWNDGMNRVGRGGQGESVWVGFFLYRLLGEMAPLCERRGDAARARRYRRHRRALGAALERAGWDGAWYRRAYFDDGSPLGSAVNDECQIDALAQAWAVISGAAPPERAARALDAVEARLIDADAGIIKLLAPPFDRGTHDPGYIKGYVPGIRENGGQYTHAAMWTIQALAILGRRERAAALLARLSPVTHGGSGERLAVYQVEPYVVAADIYGVAPHLGRGGWTWYTGAAGWMYRVAVETVLGVRLEAGDALAIRPRIPDAWPGFRVSLRLPGAAGTRYRIAVETTGGCAEEVRAATVDGMPAPIVDGAARVALADDGGDHHVRVALGPAGGAGERLSSRA